MLMNQLLKNRSGKKYAVIEAELDHCLLTEGEMASDWMSLHDTLPGNGIVTFT